MSDNAPAAAPPSQAADPPPAAPQNKDNRRGGPRGKKRTDYGRNAYRRNKDENHASKRFKRDDAGEQTAAAPDVPEGEKEERKPKRKVAVLMSYCGTGYKGMQLNPPFKTIEGDLFEAFVKAGAISKANSDDPKKSSLVRCARTDKGVHAAGNVISLKLIIEDPEVVQKINSHLPPSIRIWDIQRTTGNFSSYQLCDSRKYEYLMPSYTLLPPHPSSFLAKAIKRYAELENDVEELNKRQADVLDWWPQVTEKVYTELTPEFSREEIDNALASLSTDWDDASPRPNSNRNADEPPPPNPEADAAETNETNGRTVELAKRIRQIHLREKKAYRISPSRLEQTRTAFAMYVGTSHFHNYTVDKTYHDKSCKRFIMSFVVADPIVINGVEWLACRVHGQSFMMHQIRKMVGMAMMVVRAGCDVRRIGETMGNVKVSIGKAPSLGLHLEYPIFNHYNNVLAPKNEREKIDFEKFRTEIDAFKKEYIYDKIFDEEEKMHTFTNFVNFLDSYRNSTYLYLTSAGLKALETGQAAGDAAEAAEDSESEAAPSGDEQG
ncbi:pseudouridine synthase [Ascodesmis nigricans]|uniref:tRNA pseudouridine synthase 1 n=1 Tax=Ascodesmis nigricans TaxID=341454 RepID=A0A4V3SJQ0_9PEZI|nr:pseudouridine synthase [Ascodesmis nigricans]